MKNHKCSTEECGRPQQLPRDLCLGVQIQTGWDSQGEVGVPPWTFEEHVEGDHRSSPRITVQSSLKDVMQIGKGGFGNVFETRWLGDTYAKKEIDTHCKDFADEVNALAKLNHPHIVKVYAACSDQSSRPCFFLMEKMPCNLRTLMRSRMNQLRMNRPFSVRAGLDLMLQLSEAMSYMNSQGMVHRGLKAENILVKPLDDPELCEGFVIAKLADFGLAKVKNEVTSRMTRNTGTRWWMAPEVFGIHEKENLLDKVFPRKADVYSYGIVCSEILTGNVPYYNHPVHKHPRDLYKLITDPDNPLRPELPESCPEFLACLIRDCWHTDPVTRPTFDEISLALRYFIVLRCIMAEELTSNHFSSDDWHIIRARLRNRTFCTDTVEEKNRLESENRTLRKELEDERKARTQLAQEREIEMAEMEEMKRQLQQERQALEEEQMKLNEGTLALQTKTAAVDDMRAELESLGLARK